MRRDKSAVSEAHFRALLGGSDPEVKGQQRKKFARWLRSKGRTLEAEQQDLLATDEDAVEPGTFDYAEGLRKLGDDGCTTMEIGCGLLVRVAVGGCWDVWCDGKELRGYLQRCKREEAVLSPPDDWLANLPGQIEGPPQSVLVRLWETGFPVASSSGAEEEGRVRRVAGESNWFVARDSVLDAVVAGDGEGGAELTETDIFLLFSGDEVSGDVPRN